MEDPGPIVSQALGARPGSAEIRLLSRLAQELDKRLDGVQVREVLAALKEELLDGEPPSLDELHRKVRSCRRCPTLEGPPVLPRWNLSNPDIVLVTESSQLSDERTEGLAKDLERAGLDKKKVAITGVTRCRGQAGAEEAERCSPFLDAELAALHPQLVLAMGTLPTRTMLGTEVRVADARGRLFFAGATALMVTWSPGYAFRGGRPQEEYYEDLNSCRRFLYGDRPATN